MNTSWMLGAACARPEVAGLPWTADGASPRDRARMARVCSACPVREACEVFAAIEPVTAGFWAGHDRTRWTGQAETPVPVALVPVQDTLPGLETLGQAA